MLTMMPRIASVETSWSDHPRRTLLAETLPTTSWQVKPHRPSRPDVRVLERLSVSHTGNPIIACRDGVTIAIAHVPSGTSPSPDDRFIDIWHIGGIEGAVDASTDVRSGAMFAAYELFGEMRTSTPEENDLHRQMLRRAGKPFGKNLLDS